MQKVLFLTLHRPGRSPSQRFRFEQYLPLLNEAGISYDFSYLLNEDDDKTFYSKGKIIQKFFIILKSYFKRKSELRSISKYDIVFVQRESFMLGTSYFEKKIAAAGVNLIFDFDDSIWLQNVSDANKTFKWLKNPQKTAKIITYSNIVIAGNEYLKSYALNYNKNVFIIPTTIDTNEYKNSTTAKKEKIIIGWSGSITTIQHFELAIPFLIKIKEKYGDLIEFKVIGDSNYLNEELSIKGIAWNKQTEIEDLSTFDIGIMPLPNDEWAKGKCGLKGLQYMALEIPTIMSPVGVNSDIITDGVNGFLASETDEWAEKISLLVNNLNLRKSVGIEARRTVIENYSVEANKRLYLEIFSKNVIFQ